MYEYQRRIAAEAAKFQNTAESIELTEGKKPLKLEKPAFLIGTAVTVTHMGKLVDGVVGAFIRQMNDEDADSYVVRLKNGKTIRYPWHKVELKK